MPKFMTLLVFFLALSHLNLLFLLGLPFIIFSRNKQHFVLSLLTLEILTVNMILVYAWTFSSYDLSLFYLLLVLFVGEAVLGLALLVMVAQSKSGELMNLNIF